MWKATLHGRHEVRIWSCFCSDGSYVPCIPLELNLPVWGRISSSEIMGFQISTWWWPLSEQLTPGLGGWVWILTVLSKVYGRAGRFKRPSESTSIAEGSF